jgi:hypothetical protein
MGRGAQALASRDAGDCPVIDSKLCIKTLHSTTGWSVLLFYESRPFTETQSSG